MNRLLLELCSWVTADWVNIQKILSIISENLELKNTVQQKTLLQLNIENKRLHKVMRF